MYNGTLKLLFAYGAVVFVFYEGRLVCNLHKCRTSIVLEVKNLDIRMCTYSFIFGDSLKRFYLSTSTIFGKVTTAFQIDKHVDIYKNYKGINSIDISKS